MSKDTKGVGHSMVPPPENDKGGLLMKMGESPEGLGRFCPKNGAGEVGSREARLCNPRGLAGRTAGGASVHGSMAASPPNAHLHWIPQEKARSHQGRSPAPTSSPSPGGLDTTAAWARPEVSALGWGWVWPPHFEKLPGDSHGQVGMK